MSSVRRESSLSSLRSRQESKSPQTLTRRAKSMPTQTLTMRITSSPLTPRRKVKRTLAKTRIARTLQNSILRNRGLLRIKLGKAIAKDKMCSICLVDFDDINEATLTSCNHIFHGSCLENWLAQPISGTGNKCPLCKQSITTFTTIAESGLVLSQIEKLRLATQNITPTMHDTLISKLANFENGLITLEQQVNELHRTNPYIGINYEHAQLLIPYYFSLIKKSLLYIVMYIHMLELDLNA
jgi:hypothetical protein